MISNLGFSMKGFWFVYLAPYEGVTNMIFMIIILNFNSTSLIFYDN